MQLQNIAAVNPNQYTLSYVQNDRMAGSIPQWKTNDNSENVNPARTSFADHVSFAPQKPAIDVPDLTNIAQDDVFGLADLVDMINPLQHIPLVGHVYREISGDTIKPISKIIGGAAFGGPVGAASSIVDTIVTAETGKDMMGNAVGIVRGRREENTDTNAVIALSNLSQKPEGKSGLYAMS